MNPQPASPSIRHTHGDEIPLDNVEIVGLLQAVLSRGAAFRFRAKGWSMSPFIRNGDWITVVPLAQEKPAVGKIAAFLHPGCGQLIVHRLVSRQGEAYLVRGDNVATRADGLVAVEQMLGLVTRVERNGKRVYLGLGPERFLIAWVSKAGFLARILDKIRDLRAK